MDEELRFLEKRYAETGDVNLLRRLIAKYRRSNHPELNHAELEYLKDALKDYDVAWNSYTNRWRPPVDPRQEIEARAMGNMAEDYIRSRNQLKLTKTNLIEKAAEIGLESSYHVYRRYDIPDVNNHIEKIAILHHAVYAYASRSDDSYFGDCKFIKESDALDFIEALKRHHGYFGEDAFIQQQGRNGLFLVSWSVGK